MVADIFTVTGSTVFWGARWWSGAEHQDFIHVGLCQNNFRTRKNIVILSYVIYDQNCLHNLK